MYSDPVQAEYARLAFMYDRRWSFYINATLQATRDRLDLRPNQRVLDLGCGTGTLIQQLLRLAPDAKFTGLDASSEMLDIARQKLPESVALKVGSADQLPFPDESFDIVVSTSAFHYCRTPAQVLQEAKRVLQPAGRLVITDWCYDYWTCRILDLLLRLSNRAHFHTYGASELQTMLQNAGFCEISIEKYKIDWFWGMMTATAYKQSTTAQCDFTPVSNSSS